MFDNNSLGAKNPQNWFRCTPLVDFWDDGF